MKSVADKIILFMSLVSIGLIAPACKKFLDQKSNQSLAVPATLQDLQALLDLRNVMNKNYPGCGETSADDYFLKDNNWAAMDEFSRRLYTWEKENLFPTGNNNEWAMAYNRIYIANTVLDHIEKIQRQPGDHAAWNDVKGTALFIRALNFQHVAWNWAVAYEEATAFTEPGIPLRLNADFNSRSMRGTLKETYEQIIADFTEAATLLPEQALHVTRPSQAAAYAGLARTYLSMRDYAHALSFADQCLQRKAYLMDYGSPGQGINPAAAFPFAIYNPEVIYHCSLKYPLALYYGAVDTTFYDSYRVGDLRKTLLHKPTGMDLFKGNYEGASGDLFGGIATNEVYLIKAECLARTGNITEGMATLNHLLEKRWDHAIPYAPVLATTQEDALTTILLERRKELPYRGLRWIDLKRLNKEHRNITVTRRLNNQTYSLSPADPKYALPIPDDVIALSGIAQNPR